MILMNLMEQQGKQQKKALLDGELTEVYGQFVRVINQKDSCGATFTGLQKGNQLKEFRYSFDANQEPFAEVGKPFRATKLILQSMKILTDQEAADPSRKLPIAPNNNGRTTVWLELFMEKPKGTLGGNQTRKFFEIPVLYGKAEIIKMADPNAIISQCASITNNKGCLASFDTGECPQDPNNALVNAGVFYFGYCVNPAPPNPADSLILRCMTSI